MERRLVPEHGLTRDEPARKLSSEIVHDLRNAATSVSLAIHSLSQSAEFRSHAVQLRLEIAQKEIETVRHLLDELDIIERNR
mgnify:CR=1 FL=1